MTKQELRDDLISKGYTVAPLDKWFLVSNVDGVVKYDLSIEKDGVFQTAQCKVTGDGTQSEVATPLNSIATKIPTFSESLKTFMLSKEVGSTYAIVRREIKEEDEFAIVDAYTLENGTLTRKSYGVKRRSDVFDFKEII